MKLSATLFLLVFCFISLTGSLAQTGGISGTVTDFNTKEPLSFVNVQLTGDSVTRYATTDYDGKYRFVVLQKGTYNLSASLVGYNRATADIIVTDTVVSKDLSLVSTMSELEEVEIIDYKVPLISKDKTCASYTVGGVFAADGERSSSSGRHKEVVVEVNSNQQFKAGQLTASELNDFSKWELWNDISNNELKQQQDKWQLSPVHRYTMQVKSKDNMPVADAVVLLKSSNGDILWQSRTDNTGKAELWAGLFNGEDSEKKTMSVVYNDKEYLYGDPNIFHKGLNVLILPVDCAVPEGVDIAFMVDATGSMEDEMNYLKSELIDITRSINYNNKTLNTRLASVFYRDHGDQFVTRVSDFTTNHLLISDFMNNQNADGGGDYEEAVEEALDLAVNMKWSSNARARILFLLLDAPPHNNPGIVSSLQRTIKLAAEKGIRIVPVIASNGNGPSPLALEYLMRSIALATNGTYVFLTDHSNIGDAHATPVTDKYDVELMNDLLKRLIAQYTYIQPCAYIPEEKPDTTLVAKKIIITEIVDSTLTIASIQPDQKIVDLTITNPADTLQDNRVKIIQTGEGKQDIPAESTNQIKFYPNPTTGEITIITRGKIEEIFIVDISGKLLQIIKAGNSEIKLDLSIYSNGTYFIRFIDEGKPITGKIILRK